jgi:hypothetical protein
VDEAVAEGFEEYARGLGLPVRVALTETPDAAGEVDALRELLAEIGVEGDDVAIRPLVQRGAPRQGMEVSAPELVPEPTVTADGVHRHPVGADLESSPDLLVASAPVSLADAKRRIGRTLPRPAAGRRNAPPAAPLRDLGSRRDGRHHHRLGHVRAPGLRGRRAP